MWCRITSQAVRDSRDYWNKGKVQPITCNFKMTSSICTSVVTGISQHFCDYTWRVMVFFCGSVDHSILKSMIKYSVVMTLFISNEISFSDYRINTYHFWLFFVSVTLEVRDHPLSLGDEPLTIPHQFTRIDPTGASLYSLSQSPQSLFILPGVDHWPKWGQLDSLSQARQLEIGLKRVSSISLCGWLELVYKLGSSRITSSALQPE